MFTVPVPVFLEEGASRRRHCIPFFTYKRPSFGHSPSAEESFFLHLLSGDTRLPNHPLFHRADADAQGIGKTAVTPKKDPTGAAFIDSDEEEEEVLPPVPSFNEAIEWITNAIEYLGCIDADVDYYGRDPLDPPPASVIFPTHGTPAPHRKGAGTYDVVLVGRYSVADDCPWAVGSRSSRLQSTLEVVTVMQSSRKFALDLARQWSEVEQGLSHTLEFSLVRAMGNGGSDEWRVFVPYYIRLREKDEADKREEIPSVKLSKLELVPCTPFTAVSQRATEVCFPAFATWTKKDHYEHHQLLVERVSGVRLWARLEAYYEREEHGSSSSFPGPCAELYCVERRLETLLESLNRARGGATSHAEEGKPLSYNDVILLLAVDVLWSSARLPVYTISGAMHLFVRATSSSDMDVREDGNPPPPWIAEKPVGEDGEKVETLPVDTLTLHQEGDGQLGVDSESHFWRLLRSGAGWNQYVRTVVELQKKSYRQQEEQPCPLESDSGETEYPKFTVVATEPGDLFTAPERKEACRSGLPLELLHPELLQDNPEALAFVLEWQRRRKEEEEEEERRRKSN